MMRKKILYRSRLAGRNRWQLPFALSAWILLVLLSFLWNFVRVTGDREALALNTARAFFQQVVLTRSWNAHHGGVYVPVTSATRPNPYLDDPERDLQTVQGITLTKVNPAYMTRQLSELAREESEVQFHITSLKPIRPGNAPDPWERESLERFESGVHEVGESFHDGDTWKFRYMAPLRTERACLKCHEKQGYREGDVRGGISVVLPELGDIPLVPLGLGHLVIALVGAAGLLWLGRRLEHTYLLLNQQAAMDALTNIPNRRYFARRLQQEGRRCRRRQTPLSIIICDIDHFKRYNDRYGHPQGDHCLQEVARLVDACVQRPGDFCARYGGEEFVLVLPDTPLEGARFLAEWLRHQVESAAMPHMDVPSGVVTVSLGVSSAIPRGTDYETLIRAADRALYRAKAAGRNRVESQEGEGDPSLSHAQG